MASKEDLNCALPRYKPSTFEVSTDSAEVVQSVIGFVDSFRGIGERYDSVKAQLLGVRAVIGSYLFAHNASKGERLLLIPLIHIRARSRKPNDGV